MNIVTENISWVLGGAGAGRLQTLGGAQLLLPFAPQGSPGSVSSFQLAPGKGTLGEQCWAHIWSQRRLRTTKTTCEWDKMWEKYWVVMEIWEVKVLFVCVTNVIRNCARLHSFGLQEKVASVSTKQNN